MAKTQYYGIKYPFTHDNEDYLYLDLNRTYEDSIQAQVLHIIFTPKGQKLRDPEFGSNLIKFLFDPAAGTTLENIKAQIRNDISARVSNVVFDDIEILATDNEHERIISIYYTVKKGNTEVQNNVAIKI